MPSRGSEILLLILDIAVKRNALMTSAVESCFVVLILKPDKKPSSRFKTHEKTNILHLVEFFKDKNAWMKIADALSCINLPFINLQDSMGGLQIAKVNQPFLCLSGSFCIRLLNSSRLYKTLLEHSSHDVGNAADYSSCECAKYTHQCGACSLIFSGCGRM